MVSPVLLHQWMPSPPPPPPPPPTSGCCWSTSHHSVAVGLHCLIQFSSYNICNVVNLDTLSPDLNPAFQVNLDPGYRSRFWWPKMEKKYSWNFSKYFFDQKLQFSWPRPPERMSKLQKKSSALKREHPSLQKMKFIQGPHWIPIRIHNTGYLQHLCWEVTWI
jgi:hypothetical protein